jgi:signal transduction histidine kinase
MATTEFAGSFEQITWTGLVTTESTHREEQVSKIFVEPVIGEVVLGAARETMRNAAAHARGDKAERPLRLTIGLHQATDNRELVLTIADDGVGIKSEGIGSTRGAVAPEDSSHGSGHGLALHSTLLAMVGGYLTIARGPQAGTCVKITVPYPDLPQTPPTIPNTPSWKA